MSDQALAWLRAMCLALPEATEAGGVGDPTFRVRDKIFAMRHRVDGRYSMWCKAAPGMQDVLVSSDPQRFFVPPYVGHNGWIGVWLDVDQDWDFIAYLVKESCRLTAPKRVSALLDQTGAAGQPKNKHK
jgi:predicted DNA-binding protein (MmcQ/YjbR family)